MNRLAVLAFAGTLALVPISHLNAQNGFTTQVITAPNSAQEIVSADFNGDHRADLLVGGQYTGGGASVYLNESGSGGLFSAPAAVSGTNQLYHLAVVDLNRDGFPDFVGCSTKFQYSTPTGPFSVLTFLNDGTGHFTLKQTTAPQQGVCEGLVVGDVNRDGNPDIVTISQIPSPGMDQPGTPPPPQNFVQSWFGDGAGNLGTPVVESNIALDSNDSVNCGITSLAGANFFGDGQFNLLLHTTCLASSASQPSSTTFVARNYGDGHYTFTYIGESTETLTAHLAIDADQDGKTDVIATGTVQPANSAQHLYVEHNDGNGQFSLRDITPAAPSGQTLQFFSGITTGDWNSDNKPDLAVLYRLADASLNYTWYAAILSGDGSGAFVPAQSWVAGGTSEIFGPLVESDFNADARPDLVAINDSAYAGQYNLYLYADLPGKNSCAIPATAGHSQICRPANGGTVSSPVTITAASNENHFTLNRLYLDGNPIFDSKAESVTTSTTISTGNHTLALVSYSDDGSAITSTNTFTVGTGSGCLPASSGVQICSPTAGSTPSSPMTITAGAIASGSGYITAIRSYIDSVAVNTVYNPGKTQSFQISQQVQVGAGSHHLVVVAYESTGGALMNEVDFTATMSANNCYPSSPGEMICSPSPGATVRSPFSVAAGATAGNGFITAIRVYIDDVAQSIVYNPQQTRSFAATQSVSAGSGKHRMVIVGYQSDGNALTAAESITVP